MASTENSGVGERIKRAIGIEGDTKTVVKPMINYSLFNFSSAGSSYIISLYAMAYLTYVEKLSPGEVAIIMMLKSIWDAIIDPFLGVLTDRTRSKYGRHRIYLLIGAIPLGISFMMLWTSFGISNIGNSKITMLYYIVAYILYSTFISITSVPHSAMLPKLAPGYFLRTQYNSVGYIFNSIGMVFSFLLAAIPMGFVNTKELTPQMRPFFLFLGVLLGVFYMIPTYITGKKTHEPSSLNEKFPPFDLKYFFSEFIQLFRNRAFRQYFFVNLFMIIAYGLYLNSKVYFFREVAGVWDKYNLIMTITGIAEAASFPLNYALVKKFGKQKGAWVLTPLFFVSMAMGLFIPGVASGQTGTLIVVLIFAQSILYQVGYAGIAFTALNIYPDVTDVDEMITGRRREGVSATFNTFFKQLSVGLMAGLVGIILEWFGVATDDATGLFSARAADIFGAIATPEAGIRLVYALLPMIAMAIALFSLRGYTMTKKDHEMINAALYTKKKTGSVTLTQEEKQRCETIAGKKWGDMWIGQNNISDQPLPKDHNGGYIMPKEIEEEEEQNEEME